MSTSTPRMLRPRPALLVATTIGLALGLMSPLGADPIEDVHRERDQAQAVAVAAAQEYVDALSEQARQESEIARLEREIPLLRARAAELKQQVQERALEIYKQGTPMPLSRMVGAESVVDAARAVELTSKAAHHDNKLSLELNATAAKLERDEAELRQRKAAQDKIVEQLANRRKRLDLALAVVNQAVERVEAVAASQAEFAGADARAAGKLANGASVCPIKGPVAFVNDWGAPRSGGRTHQGNDMFAAYGTPNVAVTNGWIEWNLDDLGGQGVMLHGTDGVIYYYAHLSKFEGENHRIVPRGEVIGYVGDTGNAKGGPPHTHFGMKPEGGAYFNPYPTIRALCLQ